MQRGAKKKRRSSLKKNIKLNQFQRRKPVGKNNKQNRLSINDGGKSESMQNQQQPDEKSKEGKKPEARLIIDITCQGCGRRLTVSDTAGWRINIIGTAQFKCPFCKQVTNTTPIW